MLLQFIVQNFRSIYSPVKLNMLSTRIRELPEHKITFYGKKSCNKLAVLFGPNASGKSNILRAILNMGSMVEGLGVSRQVAGRLQNFYQPFALLKTANNEPTLLQASYMDDGSFFRYGFKYDSQKIREEWLFSGKPDNEDPIFIRNEEGLEYVDENLLSDEAFSLLKNQFSPHSLLLSVGSDLKIPPFIKASSFFGKFVIQAESSRPLATLVNDEQLLKILAGMLSYADVGITNIEKKDIETQLDGLMKHMDEKYVKFFTALKEIANELPQININKMLFFSHGSYDNHKCILSEYDESTGTKSFLRLLIILCDALKKGGLAVIDELDASLHPLLVSRALDFFVLFKKEAQIICTSHAPVIFSTKVVRRDELILVEKTPDGETFIMRASDYKEARKNANLNSRYLEGKFGGVPLIKGSKLSTIVDNVNIYLGRMS